MDSDHKNMVLIVDDDPIVSGIVEEMLLQLGYQVQKAKNGQEMLRQLRHLRPDLIILDIFMPGMDGYTALTHLRGIKEMSKVPVLLVSANPSPHHSKILTHFGTVEFLSKPFDLEELQEKLVGLEK